MHISPETPIYIVVVLLSLAIHEYAHAAIADAAGDPTPGIFGRVTLNPLAHLDKLGTLFIIMSSLAGVGFGWGKPVPMDPRKMRNPRWDHFWAVLGGPLSNLILAILCAVVLQITMLAGLGSSILGSILLIGILVNCVLMIFNLIPLGPLDGMWILGSFLPEPTRNKWIRWNLTTGQFAFLLLILPIFNGDSFIGTIVFPIMVRVANLLLPGTPFSG